MLAGYLAARSAGEDPDPRRFAAGDPEHAAEFLEALAALEELDHTLDDQPRRERVGDYRLVREVGRGGMGIVYEAEQVALKRRVALKVLPIAGMLDERQVRRFEAEARAAARLNHPHIVPVFAVGVDRGLHYYAMQFVDGMSLAVLLRTVQHDRRDDTDATLRQLQRFVGERPGGTPASITDANRGATGRIWMELAARWIAEAAEALAHSHDEGVLHRDLKPGNLLIDSSGHLWVSDFGLAHVFAHDTRLTVSGEFLGTLAYSSPEQVAGRSGMVDGRSDVYSLGVTLYQLLTLELPFTSKERSALLRQILDSEPVRPRRLDPTIPLDLETIVLKAMAKEPCDRYQTAGALAGDLRAFLADQPIRARPLTRAQRTWRWCRRNPGLALTSVFAAVAVVVGAVVAWSARVAMQQRDVARMAAVRADVATEQARARAALRSGTIGQRTAAIAHVEVAAERARTLGADRAEAEESAGLLRQTIVEALSHWDAEPVGFGAPVGAHDAAFSRDGRACGLTLASGGVAVLEVDSSELHELGEGTGGFVAGFSDDGELVEVVRERDHLVVAWRDDEVLLTWDATARGDATLSFLPDGRVLAVDGDTNAWIADPSGDARWGAGPAVPDELRESGRPTRLMALRGRPATTVVWGQRRDRSWLWRFGDQTMTRPLAGDGVYVTWFEEFPGGVLGVCDLYGRVWLEDAAGELLVLVEAHAGTVTRVAVDRYGAVAATASWDSTVRLWDAWMTAPVLDIPEAGGDLVLARFGDDLRLMCTIDTSDMSMRAWRLTEPPALTTYTAGAWPALDLPAATLHPNGRLLAMTVRDGVVFADRATRRIVGRIEISSPWSLAFSDDGGMLWVGTQAGLARIPCTFEGDDCELRSPVWSFRAEDTHVDVAGEVVCGVAYRLDGRAHAFRVGPPPSYGLDWFPEAGFGARSVDVSPDRRWMAVSSRPSGEVTVFDVEQRRIATRFEAPRARLAFSPDAGRLTLLSRDRVTDYEVGTWKELGSTPTTRASDASGWLCYSPDGELLFVFQRTECEVLRARDKRPLLRFPLAGRGNVYHPHFSADGTQIVAASMPNHAQVWDWLRIRRELRRLGLDWAPEQPLPTRAMQASRRPIRIVLPD